MSRPDDLPERLLEADATDFERRVLESALRKKPSLASSARMARALGVTVIAAGTAATVKAVALEGAASKATAAVGVSTVWPWVSVGVLGVVVAGAVVGTRAWQSSRPQAPPDSRSISAPTVPAPDPPPAIVAEPARAPGLAVRRDRTVPPARELREQIAFIDAARAAISAGAARRALQMVHRYQDRYPAGSFRPEAAALEVESLVKLGREAEARALAERFVAENRGSLLAIRVAKLAGLPAP